MSVFLAAAFLFYLFGCYALHDVPSNPCNNRCNLGRNDIQCKCDSLCSSYNDCCADSSFVNSTAERNLGEKCRQVFDSGEHFYLINTCNPKWKDTNNIRKNCLTRDYRYYTKGLLIHLPVTNVFSNTTYRNYYCAICNFDTKVTTWDLYLHNLDQIIAYNNTYKNLTTDFILQNIRYSYYYRQYKVRLWHKHKRFLFGVDFQMKINQKVRSSVRECYREISDCSLNWKNQKIRKACLSKNDPVYFMSERYGILLRYKNLHCALCNYVDISKDSSCSPRTSNGFSHDEELGKAVTVTVLVDVNLSGGEIVGEIDNKFCKEGEVYDAISKFCRKMGTIPN